MVTVTSPLGAICTKADGCCVGLSALAAWPAACAIAKCGKAPSARPPAPASFRKLRRGSVSGFVGLAAGQQALQGARQFAVVDVGQHGGSFRRVRAASATAARMRA